MLCSFIRSLLRPIAFSQKTILLYRLVGASSSTSDGSRIMDKSTAVVWDIFRPEDRPQLAEFMNSYVLPMDKKSASSSSSTTIKDPFTRDQWYLNTKQLQDLEKKFKIRPCRVYQRDGEAVMIPSGSVRQARYLTDTILTGVDFVSPETMNSTMEWSKQAREYNLQRQAKKLTDVLQADSILYFSTMAFCKVATRR